MKFLLSPKRRPVVLLVLKKSSGDTPCSVPKAKYIPLGFPVLFHSSKRFFISVFRLEAKEHIMPNMIKNVIVNMASPMAIPVRGMKMRTKKGMPIIGKKGAPVVWDILLNLSNSILASVSVMYGFALSGKNGGTTTWGCLPGAQNGKPKLDTSLSTRKEWISWSSMKQSLMIQGVSIQAKWIPWNPNEEIFLMLIFYWIFWSSRIKNVRFYWFFP